MLINENLFPNSIKNTHKKKKKKKKKKNKKKIKFTTTMVNCHQQNYHHCHFPYQHYRYRHSTYIKYQLLCCRSQKKKKNPLPFSRFQLNIEKKIIFIRKNNFQLNILRVCLIFTYFTETGNFLLKVLQIKVKVS